MGMLNDQKQRTNGIGADLVVSPSNASFMNGMSGAAMSAKLAPFLATLPHVAVAAPVIQNFSMGDSLEILYGIDYKTFNALKPFKFIAGGPFQGPDDVIVDDVWAKTGGGRHVGETVNLQTLHHDFRICGIVESGTRRAQDDPHRDPGRADRLRWQGVHHLHQERRSGQRRRHPQGDRIHPWPAGLSRAAHGRHRFDVHAGAVSRASISRSTSSSLSRSSSAFWSSFSRCTRR